MKRKNQLEREIAVDLGYAVLSHYIHEDMYDTSEGKVDYYTKAFKLISECTITDFKFVHHIFKPNEIVITCVRPGFLIGKKGIIWDRIKSEFKKSSNSKIREAELVIKEDKIHDSLYSFTVGIEFE